MTDRELLELAAKAAGHAKFSWVDGYDDYYWRGPSWGFQIDGSDVPVWNPLTDDGDALRLFICMPWMCIETSDVGVTVRERGGDNARVYFMCTEWLSDHDGGIDSATRRAIVRAAAEIGRAMGTP